MMMTSVCFVLFFQGVPPVSSDRPTKHIYAPTMGGLQKYILTHQSLVEILLKRNDCHLRL